MIVKGKNLLICSIKPRVGLSAAQANLNSRKFKYFADLHFAIASDGGETILETDSGPQTKRPSSNLLTPRTQPN
jgi:hypothetical protein